MPKRAGLLLAEDDPVSRAFLGEALASGGHRVETVDDGANALRRLRERRYDLALLDLGLPRIGGFDLLQRLRADPHAASRSTPAVALTADACDVQFERLRDAGFHALLNKPIAIDDLLDAVVAALTGGAPLTASSVLPATGSASCSDWDDQVALAASNGSLDIVNALRPMLLAELPQQRASILLAVNKGDLMQATGELHRLRAACGFCGATRLAAAVDRLAATLKDQQDFTAASDEFADASARLLVRPPSGY